MRQKYTWLLIGFALLSCEKNEDPTPDELIVGKWTIVSTELLGQTVPGDGSYLRFDECNSECTGMDYLASNMSSGEFNYDLSSDASELSIADTSAAGGNYHATWDVLELTETDLRIVGNTIFGSLKIEMEK